MAAKEKVRNYALLPDGKWKLMIPVFVGILACLVTIPLMKLDIAFAGSRDVYISALHQIVAALMSSMDVVLPLVAGSVQVVDLPPGIAATAQLESADDLWVGVHARSVAIDVVGGLGGLLVDTRETPLRLPDRAERRRQLLESWERPLWIGGDW